jgi:ornithine cyclodeaminase/alanine dehydrogenase-like protein (mu-crystallin family)
LLTIDPEELARRLPMIGAIDALERAFEIDRPETPLRSHHEVPDGTVFLMPAAGPEGVGVKLIAINPDNPARGLPYIQGAYVLFDPGTLAPAAVIDGAALTGLRTAAVSGLATRHLARRDARRLVIFGAGVQGKKHLDSMLAVREITDVTVVSRSEGPAEQLAERARAAGCRARVGEAGAVADAHIICTCTTSAEPLFDGTLLPPGAHINAIGAYQPDRRELDTASITRSRVVVESREAALEEAGDLLIPIEEGAITPDHIVADLAEVVRGAAVRTSEEDVTVFKSVGVAFEDLAVTRAAVEGA